MNGTAQYLKARAEIKRAFALSEWERQAAYNAWDAAHLYEVEGLKSYLKEAKYWLSWNPGQMNGNKAT